MKFNTATRALALFVEKLGARSRLTPDQAEALMGLPGSPRRVAAHGEIVAQGQHVDHACLVAEGFVARFAQMEDGRRQLISIHIAGDMVDLYSLMLPAAPSPLVALTSTTLFQIPHAALRNLVAAQPAIGSAFWADCVADGKIIAQWLVSTGRRDARSRIAHFLCEMAVRSDQIGRLIDGRFPFPIIQEQIADALGLTPVHVNRSLKRLREEGLAQMTRTEVIILDWERLALAGDFDPAYLNLPRRGTGEDASTRFPAYLS